MELLKLHKKMEDLKTQRSKIVVDVMATIQEQVDAIDKDVRDMKAVIDKRVSDIVQAARKSTGKKTGILNVEAEGVKIKHDQPKRITWDQYELAALSAVIGNSGSNPAEYINTTYSVDERKFQAWPKAIQDKFKAARTEAPGKPSYKITIPKPAEAGGWNLPGK